MMGMGKGGAGGRSGAWDSPTTLPRVEALLREGLWVLGQ